MRLRYYALIIVLMISTLLTGCASVYVSPEAGPKAQLGVLNQKLVQNLNTQLIFDDPIKCTEVRYLGRLKTRLTGAPKTIPADQLITIMDEHSFSGNGPVSFIVTFYPRANEKYLVKTENHRVNSFTYESVFSIVREVRRSDGSISYEHTPFIRRKLKRDFINGLLKTECTDKAVQKKLLTLQQRLSQPITRKQFLKTIKKHYKFTNVVRNNS